MIFRKLSEYFQKLESTPSRNAMTKLLSELFQEAKPDEIAKIAYLLQGRVAPFYEPIEFQMADKMVVKALAKAYGVAVDNVTKDFKKLGDLGAVAEIKRQKSPVQSSKPETVNAVYDKLRKVTAISGVGSVEKKITILSNLLKESGTLSAKYLTRIVLDKLRLGFSDMTILDALSWMIDQTKNHKPTIEAAYNIRPDLGYIAKSVKDQGTTGVKRVRPKLGTPILPMRAERLTRPQEILEKTDGQCAVEPKLDGIRIQLHYSPSLVRLYSRGLENATHMYPDLVASAKKEIKAQEAVLDGEAIGFDPKTGKYLPFQKTVQRKRKYDIESFTRRVPLKYVVFDCLYLNGESFLDKPYIERREALERSIKNDPSLIIPVQMHLVAKPQELEKLFQGYLKRGLEGIMAKKTRGVYQAGARGWNWIKYKQSYSDKLADTVDAVVMGLDLGEGKRSKFGVGAFLVGIYDQKSDTYKTISKIGTGLTDKEWKELKVKSQKLKVPQKPKNYDVNKLTSCDVWLKPSLVGEFRADELTKSPLHTAGYALRFPRLEKWRDKKPEDSTSLKEIEKLAKIGR